MKLLQPIKDKDSYSEEIHKYIARQMYDAIFAPLFNILGRRPEQTTLSNAIDKSSLKNALLSGIVWYKNDKFYGSFNSSIGRELRKIGANFNSQDKTYFMKQIDIPMEIRAIIGEANSKFQGQQNALLSTLNKMSIPPILDVRDINPKLDSMFIDLNKQFSTSIPRDLAVPMVLTENMRGDIAAEYTNNMNLYIKDWYQKDIIKLRQRVEEAVATGYRADHMRDVLEAEFGVADRKAKFLARQEGSLLVSKYRQTRYQAAGLNKYVWSTSHDIRVRHDHAELNGKVFDYDHPPITDKATGARNNPGMDYNCRCISIPIIE